MDCNLPGSSVRGILQAGILGWLPFPFPWDPPNPGIEPGLLLQEDPLPLSHQGGPHVLWVGLIDREHSAQQPICDWKVFSVL